MKGDPKVVDYLNKGLRSELTATDQYGLHIGLVDNRAGKGVAGQ